MKNIFRKQSNLKLPRKKGNRQIQNEVWKALMKSDFSKGEYKVIMSVIDHTWGYNKEFDAISVSMIAEDTNLKEQSVRKIISGLEKKLVILKEISNIYVRGQALNNYMFNKFFDTWEDVCPIPQDTPNQALALSGGIPQNEVSPIQPERLPYPTGALALSGGIPTKEKKENIKKDCNTKPKSEHHQAIKHFNQKFKEKFGENYNFVGKTDGPHFSRLLKTYSFQKLKEIIDCFFLVKDHWINTTDYSVHVLNQTASSLVVDLNKRIKSKFNDEKNQVIGYDIFEATGKSPLQMAIEEQKQKSKSQKTDLQKNREEVY